MDDDARTDAQRGIDPADHPWLATLAGRFVVFDGPDGSGKTTQFRRCADAARKAGARVLEVREPGGTPIGERVRAVLLDPQLAEMSARCELMLYMASRAQLVHERIAPAIADGQLVLADRYVSSTLAYQGSAGGLPTDEILAVARAACGRAWPDLVVVFDVDEATAAARLNPLLDRIEQKGAEFHRAVRAGYLQQAADEPHRYAVIDARADQNTVFDATMAALRERLAP